MHTCTHIPTHLFSQHRLQCLNKGQSKDRRRLGVKADLKDVAVSMVGPELCHKACDHVILVCEGRDASLKAGRLVEEQVLRGKQQVLFQCVCAWGRRETNSAKYMYVLNRCTISSHLFHDLQCRHNILCRSCCTMININ